MIRKHDGPEVFRITGAGPALSEDVNRRQRRYAISMAVRTLSFLAAVLLWHVQIVLAVIALVLGGVLPYVAVVVANAGREGGKPLPSVDPGEDRPRLGAPGDRRTGGDGSGSRPDGQELPPHGPL